MKNNTKKIHKKKGGTASKKPKSPGKTVKKTPKQKRDIQSSMKKKDDANKIAIFNRHRIVDENVLPYADNSLLRALTRYSSEYVENLSATDIESIYKEWRKIESEARKGHRERKINEGKGSTPGAQKQTVQRKRITINKSDITDAANNAAEAAETLANMDKYGNAEFQVPSSPTPLILEDKPLPGFTFSPNHKRKTPMQINPSNPQNLFRVPTDYEILDDDFLPDLNEDENL